MKNEKEVLHVTFLLKSPLSYSYVVLQFPNSRTDKHHRHWEVLWWGIKSLSSKPTLPVSRQHSCWMFHITRRKHLLVWNMTLRAGSYNGMSSRLQMCPHNVLSYWDVSEHLSHWWNTKARICSSMLFSGFSLFNCHLMSLWFQVHMISS